MYLEFEIRTNLKLLPDYLQTASDEQFSENGNSGSGSLKNLEPKNSIRECQKIPFENRWRKCSSIYSLRYPNSKFS